MTNTCCKCKLGDTIKPFIRHLNRILFCFARTCSLFCNLVFGELLWRYLPILLWTKQLPTQLDIPIICLLVGVRIGLLSNLIFLELCRINTVKVVVFGLSLLFVFVDVDVDALVVLVLLLNCLRSQLLTLIVSNHVLIVSVGEWPIVVEIKFSVRLRDLEIVVHRV